MTKICLDEGVSVQLGRWDDAMSVREKAFLKRFLRFRSRCRGITLFGECEGPVVWLLFFFHQPSQDAVSFLTLNGL